MHQRSIVQQNLCRTETVLGSIGKDQSTPSSRGAAAKTSGHASAERGSNNHDIRIIRNSRTNEWPEPGGRLKKPERSALLDSGMPNVEHIIIRSAPRGLKLRHCSDHRRHQARLSANDVCLGATGPASRALVLQAVPWINMLVL